MEINNFINLIFPNEQIKEIQKIADDFMNIPVKDFYKKYEKKLFLEYFEDIEIFENIQNETLKNESSNESSKFIESYKHNNEDLTNLIFWIMTNEEIVFPINTNDKDLEADLLIEFINHRLKNIEINNFSMEYTYQKINSLQKVKEFITNINNNLLKNGLELIKFNIDEFEDYYGVFKIKESENIIKECKNSAIKAIRVLE